MFLRASIAVYENVVMKKWNVNEVFVEDSSAIRIA